MRRVGRQGFQLTMDVPEGLAIGLYVRDIIGLPSKHAWVPPAAPAITPIKGRGPKAAAAAQWDRWWTETLAGYTRAWAAPDFAALDHAPALRDFVAAHFQDAVRWSNERQRENRALMIDRNRPPVETKLLSDLERAAGRPVQPFELRVTEIPVAGLGLWELNPHHILISAELFADTDEYRRCLTPIVQVLV